MIWDPLWGEAKMTGPKWEKHKHMMAGQGALSIRNLFAKQPHSKAVLTVPLGCCL